MAFLESKQLRRKVLTLVDIRLLNLILLGKSQHEIVGAVKNIKPQTVGRHLKKLARYRIAYLKIRSKPNYWAINPQLSINLDMVEKWVRTGAGVYLLEFHNARLKLPIIRRGNKVRLDSVFRVRNWEGGYKQEDFYKVKFNKNSLEFLMQHHLVDLTVEGGGVVVQRLHSLAFGTMLRAARSFMLKYAWELDLSSPVFSMQEVKVRNVRMQKALVPLPEYHARLHKKVYKEGDIEFYDTEAAANFIDSIAVVNRMDTLEQHIKALTASIGRQAGALEGLTNTIEKPQGAAAPQVCLKADRTPSYIG